MFRASVVFLLTFLFIMNAQAYEEAKYKLLSRDGNVEIRMYKKAYLAKYNSPGNMKAAGNKSFMPLFNYIKDGGIPMTTPVTLEQVKPNEWDVSFFMPAYTSIKDLPKPANSKIKLTELKERKMIVYKFTGSMNKQNFKKYNPKLMQYIKENHLKIKDQVVSAAYNAPFTPWFMKRSEIMYELK